MSTTSQVLKQAKQEVLSGADRRTVFEKYQSQFPKPLKLATVISNIPKGPIPPLARVLNIVLIVLLFLAALSKAIAVLAILSDAPAVPAILGVLLSIALPVIFAIAAIKWEGQVYLMLPLLCLLGILRSWMKNPALDAAIDTFFLLAIAGVAVAIKLIVFPNIGFRGVKKDASGQYVF